MWGVPDKDKKKIQDHLTAVRILKERGVKGSGIIGAYHTQNLFVSPTLIEPPRVARIRSRVGSFL